jgi:inorganic pyrophosphatase
LNDVKKSKLDEILHWFRYYKTSDGKPENNFGYSGKIFDEKFAFKIIKEMNENWKNMKK